MLLPLLTLLFRDPLQFLAVLPIVLATLGLALLVAITVHEFGHALAAHALGDDTARRLGRLSLNPIRHLDPLGTVLLLLIGFGWGKPVPVNPYAIGVRMDHMKAMALVALAGPLANFVTAGIVGIPLKMGAIASSGALFSLDQGLVGNIMGYIVFYNIILGVFNLIPLPPLDGFKVLLGILPRRPALALARVENYGPMLLIAVLAFDSFSHQSFLWGGLRTVAQFLGMLFAGRPLP